MITRRGLIGGLAAFIAAPAIIRVASIMPIKAFDEVPLLVNVPHRAFVVLSDGLLYWSDQTDPLIWSRINRDPLEGWSNEWKLFHRRETSTS